MFDKKNHIGRPTNEELRNRKIKKIAIFSIPVVLVLFAVVFISTGSFSSLMGDSVTQNGTQYISFSENVPTTPITLLLLARTCLTFVISKVKVSPVSKL